MKKYLFYLFIGFFVVQASPAFAEDAPKGNDAAAEKPADRPSEQPKDSGPSSKSSDPARLPKLAIRWDCGTCALNDKVPPLIVKSYADEAAKHGQALSDSETAELVITDFNQRPPGARVTLGILAGKDVLGVRILYHTKEAKAEDTASSAWFGMDSLCESVGKQTYEELASILKNEQAGR
jgi:hypothetical protein